MRRTGWTTLTLLLMSMMSMMAGAFVSPALPLITRRFQHLEHVELLARLVTTMPALFIAIFAPLVGYLIDKFGRRKLLLGSLGGYAVAGSSGAFIDDLYLILIGRALLGVSIAGVMTISTTLVGDFFRGPERNRFMGLQGAFIGFGGVLLIMTAGVLADLHWHAPFYIYLLSLPLILLAVFSIPEPELRQPGDASMSPPAASLPRRRIPMILGTIFLGVVFFYMVPVQVPFLVGDIKGTTGAMIGYAISMSTLTSSLVALFYGIIKRYLSFSAIYSIAFALIGLGYSAISYCNEYPQYLAAIALAGCGVGLFLPTGNLWIMALTPAHLRGRRMGWSSTAFFLGMFFSPIVVQPVVTFFSIHQAFRLAGAAMFAIAVFYLVLSRRPDPAEATFHSHMIGRPSVRT